MVISTLVFEHCAELAGFKTLAAPDAERLIYRMGLFLFPADSLHGTRLGAGHAAFACVFPDRISEEGRTAMGRAFLMPDMGFIFFREIFEGREHGVGRRLPETADRVVLDLVCQVLKQRDIPLF